ncbi:hypothetical protein [Neptuniibacter sp. QD37_11]|uniref:hypothetical protein n=1 Tax=Neptuniibacter sp. QD37_11 TaxID=3398209 RepID=UPI0039F4A221
MDYQLVNAQCYFDNFVGRYLWNDEFLLIPWFVDQNGQLYIIPEQSDTFGPDNDTMGALIEQIRKAAGDVESFVEGICAELNLTLVEQGLRKIDSLHGPYVR